MIGPRPKFWTIRTGDPGVNPNVAKRLATPRPPLTAWTVATAFGGTSLSLS